MTGRAGGRSVRRAVGGRITRMVAWCGLAVLSIAAPARDAVTPPEAPAWREVRWPFPLDPWPAGRAFRCTGGTCGHEVRITVRPKLGFCNCTTGVADDDEIDRVSDLVALDDRYTPSEPGWPVTIGPLEGRARRYRFARPGGRQRFALALALSRRCDVAVALVYSDAPLDAAVERSALQVLDSVPTL